MAVSKALQAGAKAGAGDLVSVAMEANRSERVVVVPAELQQALASGMQVQAAFDSLSYAHRKEFADWVASAKREEMRQGHAEQSIAMVLATKHVR